MDDLEAKGNMYLQLAQTYLHRKVYEKSDEYAAKASALLDEVGDKAHLIDWQRQLSLLKLNKLNWKSTARELLDLALLYENQSDHNQAGNVYADVAAIYLENGELEEAWDFAEKARLILPYNHLAMGKVNRVLAFLYFRNGDQEKGSKYLNNATAIFEVHGALAEYEEVTMHMCHYLSEQGRHREAFERVEKLHDFMAKKLSDRGIAL